MIKIDNFNNIQVSRGETFNLTITAEDENGNPYVFQPGDELVFIISEDYDANKYFRTKTVEITEEIDKVPFSFEESFTMFDDKNDTVSLHYEVKLITAAGQTQTIIGKDDEYEYLFVIYPSFYKEGEEI